jgi:murein DD-endopeptidase MepM/ murein hydrolase activator NlpD
MMNEPGTEVTNTLQKLIQRMNLILIGKPFKTPKTIELSKRSVQFMLGGAAALALVAVVASSFMVGRLFGDVQGVTRSQLTGLRGQLNGQAQALNQTQEQAKRDLNALAMQIGELQAHASRLDSLGSRLTKIGKLDDGEFNFGKTPAMGGPEGEEDSADFLSSEFGRTVSTLRRQFESQDQQLNLLESMLLDKNLDASMMPKGMPVRSGYSSSGFGTRVDPINGAFSFHPGVDFPGPYGTDVIAVAAGVVTWNGVRPGFGNVVEIDHGNGYKTRYGHNSQNIVSVGDRVKPGQLIAKMGSTGRSTGSHVHLEVWYEDKLINPAEFVSAIR